MTFSELITKIEGIERKIELINALNMNKCFFNAKEAALYTGLSESSIRKNAVTIKTSPKKTKKLIFTKQELDNFMSECF